MVTENDLEQGLLDHLQEFLLELGHGFCLEGRQKRILIGNEYFFIDLVFYHCLLKCHVLIKLKIADFNHVNAGQLNTYLNYYKAAVMRSDDQLPVGILLLTHKTMPWCNTPPPDSITSYLCRSTWYNCRLKNKWKILYEMNCGSMEASCGS